MMNRKEFITKFMASTIASVSFNHFPVLCAQQRRFQRSQTHYQSWKTYPNWESDNVFLKGINAPVFHEVEIDSLPVTGEIPLDIEGMYLRNGSNPMFKPSTYNYPLEGDGMLHRFYFQQGKVSYRNRWLKTRGLVYEMFEGKQLEEFKFKNSANTNIISHAGKILALYEIGLPYEVTPELETVGEWNFEGELEQSMTAHPKKDIATGELHFYRYSLFNQPYLHYYIADRQGKIIRKSAIDIAKPVLIHDMALTKNYAIFFVNPLVFDMEKAMNHQTPFTWQPDQGTNIILVNRHHPEQKPISLTTEAFWVWHFMNAYEENNQIIVDCIYYPQMNLEPTMKAMLTNRSNLERAIIDLHDRTVTLEKLDDRYVDFPCIDGRKLGQPYRFGYVPYIDTSLWSQKKIPNYFPELIQYDLIARTEKIHRFRPGVYGAEATFIPRSNSSSELEGYIITLVFDENKNTSELLILDPHNFEGEPLAVVHLPVRVPSGFHGNWLYL